MYERVDQVSVANRAKVRARFSFDLRSSLQIYSISKGHRRICSTIKPINPLANTLMIRLYAVLLCAPWLAVPAYGQIVRHPEILANARHIEVVVITGGPDSLAIPCMPSEDSLQTMVELQLQQAGFEIDPYALDPLMVFVTVSAIHKDSCITRSEVRVEYYVMFFGEMKADLGFKTTDGVFTQPFRHPALLTSKATSERSRERVREYVQDATDYLINEIMKARGSQ